MLLALLSSQKAGWIPKHYLQPQKQTFDPKSEAQKIIPILFVGRISHLILELSKKIKRSTKKMKRMGRRKKQPEQVLRSPNLPPFSLLPEFL